MEVEEEELVEEKWRVKLKSMRRNSCTCSRCGATSEMERRLDKIDLEFRINQELERRMAEIRAEAQRLR